jgi:hypothetical protein
MQPFPAHMPMITFEPGDWRAEASMRHEKIFLLEEGLGRLGHGAEVEVCVPLAHILRLLFQLGAARVHPVHARAVPFPDHAVVGLRELDAELAECEVVGEGLHIVTFKRLLEG